MLCSTRRFAKRFAPENEMSPALRRGGCSSPRRGDTSFRPAGHKPRQRRGGIASGGCAEAFRARRGRNIPNFIRQIFNGRKRSDPYHSSCDAEARFYGRPKGVRTTDRETKKRTTERLGFLRVSAISRLAPLFCILFSGKTEKSMPAERQLRSYRKNGTSGESGKEVSPLRGDTSRVLLARIRIF